MQSVCVRVDSGKLKQWILDETGYDGVGDFRKKSRLIPVDINVMVKQTGKKKTKKKIPIDQKQIVFISQKYADRSKYKRTELLAKVADLISDTSKYYRATHYGTADYIKTTNLIKKPVKSLNRNKF